MVTYNSLMVRTRDMPDCNKAKALVDWIYWTQTDEDASSLAQE